MPQWPYGAPEWERLRMRKLQEAPLCEPCQVAGRVVVANVIDHNVPISQGGPAFPTLDGLTSMCWRCHNAKTQGERKGKTFLAKGCDAAGMPVDKQHPFYYGGTTHQVVSPRQQKNKALHSNRSGTSTTSPSTSAQSRIEDEIIGAYPPPCFGGGLFPSEASLEFLVGPFVVGNSI